MLESRIGSSRSSRSERSASPVILPLIAAALCAPGALAHGTLVNGRMYQVRAAGPSGHAPAAWNESYYTWNQNSHNFSDYASAGFTYSAAVPDGTIASAGINDGTNVDGHTALDFSGLNTPSAGWTTSAATAGQAFSLRFIASAPHDPSFFKVFLTKPGFDPAAQTLAWSSLDDLGNWAVEDTARPVTFGTAPGPAGGTSMSYDFNVPVPANRSGRGTFVVVWQRVDPAGEAFFAVQDVLISPVPEPALVGPAAAIAGALLPRRRRACRSNAGSRRVCF